MRTLVARREGADACGHDEASRDIFARRLVEVVQATCRLEGGTLRLGETAAVLETGSVDAAFPFLDYAAAIGERDALLVARTLAERDGPVSARDIGRMTGLLFQDERPAVVGRGTRPDEVRRKMLRIRRPDLFACDELLAGELVWREGGSEIFDLHAKVLEIEPRLVDAGRVARFAVNLGLILDGEPPIAIPDEVAEEYRLLVERHLYERRYQRGAHVARDGFRFFMSKRLDEARRSVAAMGSLRRASSLVP